MLGNVGGVSHVFTAVFTLTPIYGPLRQKGDSSDDLHAFEQGQAVSCYQGQGYARLPGRSPSMIGVTDPRRNRMKRAAGGED